MKKLEKIKLIKENSSPPFSKDDRYNLRYPWPKFGNVSSKSNMEWVWFSDRKINAKASEIDVNNAMLSMYGKQVL